MAALQPGKLRSGIDRACFLAGAEAAVLFGDPSEEGLFAPQLKVPSGYAVPPHTHPVHEVVSSRSRDYQSWNGRNR